MHFINLSGYLAASVQIKPVELTVYVLEIVLMSFTSIELNNFITVAFFELLQFLSLLDLE